MSALQFTRTAADMIQEDDENTLQLSRRKLLAAAGGYGLVAATAASVLPVGSAQAASANRTPQLGEQGKPDPGMGEQRQWWRKGPVRAPASLLRRGFVKECRQLRAFLACHR
jgi:hypothetical protein